MSRTGSSGIRKWPKGMDISQHKVEFELAFQHFMEGFSEMPDVRVGKSGSSGPRKWPKGEKAPDLVPKGMENQVFSVPRKKAPANLAQQQMALTRWAEELGMVLANPKFRGKEMAHDDPVLAKAISDHCKGKVIPKRKMKVSKRSRVPV